VQREERRLRDASGIARRFERAHKYGRTGARRHGWLLARSLIATTVAPTTTFA